MSVRRDDRPRHSARGAGRRPPAPRPPRRPRGRWALPAILVAGAVCSAAGSVVLDSPPTAAPVGIAAVPATPVLSARRAPEVIAAPVADRRLTADLDAWLARSPAHTCLVVDAQGRDAFSHNPVVPVTGASTQKLLTSTGLLLALGPDATFHTTAVAAQAPRDGVVAGDLYVVGGGDANLGTPDWPPQSPGDRPRVVHDIDALAAAVASTGVRRIDGSVVGDGSRYDSQRYEPSLARRLIEQDQVGPIGGLMVNDGFARFSPARSFASTVPAADPAADAARVLTARLAAHGVAVTGPPRAGTAPQGAVTVATMSSPKLPQVIADMLTYSDNETAESAIKEVGHAVSGQGSWPAGAADLTRLLTRAGVPLDGVTVVDGTGLSIKDQLTCRTLVDVLSRPRTGPVLRKGLPVAGESGTLADRWRGTPVAGRLRAKTGTLRNVTALAGEVTTLSGGTVTFAYVANVADPGSVTNENVDMDELGNLLVAYPRGVDIAALEPRPAQG